MYTSPGTFLKAARLRLQLGVREIQQMSSKIAVREHNRRFYISAARLAQIENDNAVPSQFKAFTLAAIYGISFYEILSRYGVDPDRAHDYRTEVKLPVTRPVTSEVVNVDATVTLPVRLAPAAPSGKTPSDWKLFTSRLRPAAARPFQSSRLTAL